MRASDQAGYVSLVFGTFNLYLQNCVVKLIFPSVTKLVLVSDEKDMSSASLSSSCRDRTTEVYKIVTRDIPRSRITFRQIDALKRRLTCIPSNFSILQESKSSWPRGRKRPRRLFAYFFMTNVLRHLNNLSKYSR